MRMCVGWDTIRFGWEGDGRRFCRQLTCVWIERLLFRINNLMWLRIWLRIWHWVRLRVLKALESNGCFLWRYVVVWNEILAITLVFHSTFIFEKLFQSFCLSGWPTQRAIAFDNKRNWLCNRTFNSEKVLRYIRATFSKNRLNVKRKALRFSVSLSVCFSSLYALYVHIRLRIPLNIQFGSRYVSLNLYVNVYSE